MLEFWNHDLMDVEEPECKCECGADAANAPFHSSWCPKGT